MISNNCGSIGDNSSDNSRRKGGIIHHSIISHRDLFLYPYL